MNNYNILQLNAKELSELKDIAAELGLKVSGSANKDKLIYDILDQQAIVGAQKKSTANESKEADRKKRMRVTVKKNKEEAPKTNNQEIKEIPQQKENLPVVPKNEKKGAKVKKVSIAKDVPQNDVEEAPIKTGKEKKNIAKKIDKKKVNEPKAIEEINFPEDVDSVIEPKPTLEIKAKNENIEIHLPKPQNNGNGDGNGHNSQVTRNKFNSRQDKNEKLFDFDRSEERRVGKECRSRWSPYH